LELAELLAISALGSRGDPEEVKRQLKAWQAGLMEFPKWR